MPLVQAVNQLKPDRDMVIRECKQIKDDVFSNAYEDAQVESYKLERIDIVV